MCGRVASTTLFVILGMTWLASDHAFGAENADEWVKQGSAVYVSKSLTPQVDVGQPSASFAGQGLTGSYPHCTLMKVYAVTEASLIVQDPKNSHWQMALGADWRLWVHRTQNECHDVVFERWRRSSADSSDKTPSKWPTKGSIVFMSKGMPSVYEERGADRATGPERASPGSAPGSSSGQSSMKVTLPGYGSYVPACVRLEVRKISATEISLRDPAHPNQRFYLGQDWKQWAHRTNEACEASRHAKNRSDPEVADLPSE